MADGRIEIQIRINDSQLKKAEGSMKSFTGSILAAKVVTSVFKAIAGSLDNAIKRFDTLNQYPKVLEQMGFSAEDASRSTDRLSQGIQGLPTRLDEVVSTSQRFVTVFRDVDLATESTLALNNALLASGASGSQAANATDQYVKMISSGKIEMDNWNTLSETMSYALSEVSKQMGYSETNTWELYNALKNGDVELRDFNSALIEASKAQGGFADIALTSTEGIATSWANIKTAITNGVEGMIRAIDDMSKSLTGSSIAANMDILKVMVQKAFKAMQDAIRATEPVVGALLTVLSGGIWVIEKFDFVILGLVAGFLAMKIIPQVTLWLKGMELVVMTISNTTAIYGAVNDVLMTSVIGVTKAQTAMGIVTAVLTGQVSLATIATTLFGKAVTFLKAAINPLYLVVAAVVAIGAGLFKFFTRTTPEVKEMNSAVEEATAEMQEMNSAMESSARAYESNRKHIDNQSNATKQLAVDTIDLASATELNAGEKKILQEQMETLNDSVEGLNLSYDEENGLLSESADYIMHRVEAMQEEEKMIAAQERLHEIKIERGEADDLLAEKQLKLVEAQELLDNSGQTLFGGNKDLKESIAELEEEITTLKTGMGDLSEEEKRVREDSIAAAEAHTAALAAAEEQRLADLRASVEEHGWLYEQLGDDQRAAIDTMADDLTEMADNQQNAFSRMNDESSVSAEEMLANLEHNAKMTKQWGDDRAAMMEIASQEGNEGFLRWLEDLGPDSAAELNTVRNMSEDQLDEFIQLMNDAPEEATDSYRTSLGDGMDEAADLAVEKAGLIEDSIYETVNKEAFAELGEEIGIGLTDGIESSADDAVDASGQMGEAVIDEFGNTLGIQSPSTVFIAHGKDITKGTEMGIKQGTPAVMSAIREMGTQMNKTMEQAVTQLTTGSNRSFSEFSRSLTKAARDTSTGMKLIQTTIKATMTSIQMDFKMSTTEMNNLWKEMFSSMSSKTLSGSSRILTAFNSMMSSAKSTSRSTTTAVVSNLNSGISGATNAGVMMGRGFNNGLASTRNQVLATARNIAVSASNAIRSSLKIKSPSRVTFGLGENTGEGFVDGMSSMVKKVRNVAGDLADSAIPNVNPLSPFGQLGVASAGGSYNSSSVVNIHIDKIENNSDSDIPQILEESAWVMAREGARLT